VSSLTPSAAHAADVVGARRSADPGDDYLLALAEREHAFLVSGDRHVLAFAEELPVQSARNFLERLEV
jgi:predicted nucleic acid-binding protein